LAVMLIVCPLFFAWYRKCFLIAAPTVLIAI
jgi:hypothetical protein